MLDTAHSTPDPIARTQRADGAEARNQLLMAALRLFSAQGFAKTSVRDIAQAAGANVASIRYYFGDKAGLYRATFFNALDDCGADTDMFSDPSMPLGTALQHLFAGFLRPLKQGETFALQMRLQMREMIDPTGLWDEELERNIRPHHDALVALLRRSLDLPLPDDDDLHRLAFSIVGMAIHLLVGREIMQAIRPTLCATPEAIDQWADRLAVFAMGMVQAEAQRRGIALVTSARPSP
jgi:AcrR family transcriptional regulator